MITYNVAIASGIANRTKATVTRFFWPENVTFTLANVTVNSVPLQVHVPSYLPVAIVIHVDDSLPFTPPPVVPPRIQLGNYEFLILL